MKTLEETIATAMDAGQDTEIIPYLPYILQDFWELGTPPEMVINLVQKNFPVETWRAASLPRVLDLGCGKGAVSVKLSAALKCHCYGIDGIPEFIEASKEKAREYGVEALCRFEVGDIRTKIEELDKFDVIILGATGPIFDDYSTAMTTLSKHLTDDGMIIVEEGYIDDTSDFQHPQYMSRNALLKQFAQAGMELIDETVCKYGEVANIAKEMEYITARCNELKAKYPEKSSIFYNYAKNQASEFNVLENEMDGSVMALKKVKMNVVDYEFIKTRLSPCGLHCGNCFAFSEGKICQLSSELKENLGNFDVYAERFVNLLNEPLFLKYPDFKEMLNYFASGKCKGCRKENCVLFKSCNVRTCSEKQRVDFCFQCSEFPCNDTGFDENLQNRWKLANNKMKECGVEAYYNEIRNTPRY